MKLVHDRVKAGVLLAFLILDFLQHQPAVLRLPQETSRPLHRLQRNGVRVLAEAGTHLEVLEDSGALRDLSPVAAVDAHRVVRVVFRHEPQCLAWSV